MAAVSAGRTAQIRELMQPDSLAAEVTNLFLQWEQYRNTWSMEKEEILGFIFATDTRKTTGADLPWKNSTTMPKLTQIRDNLHANYLAALQSGQWLTWVADDREDNVVATKDAIKAYMHNKLEEGGFFEVLSRLLLDYIDYGNVFGDVEYVSESHDHPEQGNIPGYVGPRAVRISPNNITFNPIAARFADSPKVTRSVMPMGDLLVLAQERPDLGYDVDEIKKSIFIRNEWKSYSMGEKNKAVQMRKDGFGDFAAYMDSGTVEIIELEGNVYDWTRQELLKNHVITVIDRSQVLRKEPNPSWTPKGTKVHAAWRERPDNLYGMGPMDNLVGIQYRINHLENLKADAFDLIIHPPYTTKGAVEDFVWAPGEEIMLGEDGEIAFMRPDSSVLQTDSEIQFLEDKMEEYAGSPKMQMGVRTPGEKTAFEVDVLDTAGSRIFMAKVRQFEEHVLEPLLNHMLTHARQHMDAADVVRVTDEQTGITRWVPITPEQLTARGKIRAAGSKHFIAKQKLFQTFVQLYSGAMGTDPAVMNHISGETVAMLLFDDLQGVEGAKVFKKNARLMEESESAKVQQTIQRQLAENELVDDDEEIPPEVPIG
jgi:hypothetical protein